MIGIHTFVVAGPLIVDVNVSFPGLSTWSCEATPISEKTGKTMVGSSHGADGSRQPTVRIKGDFDPSWDSEEFENQRLLMVVATASKFLSDASGTAADAVGEGNVKS